MSVNLMLTVFQEEALPLSSDCCHRCYFVIVTPTAAIALAVVLSSFGVFVSVLTCNFIEFI